jgi:non-heme Fe2+,alpha-ketoglutarate-dependent halogenase
MRLDKKILMSRLGLQKVYVQKYTKLSMPKKLLFWVKTGFGYCFLQWRGFKSRFSKSQPKPVIDTFKCYKPLVDQSLIDPSSDNYYLSKDEIEKFEREGVIGPFDLVTNNEAKKIKSVIDKKLLSGEVIHGPFLELQGEERKAFFKSNGLPKEDRRAAGFDRHKNIAEFERLLKSDKITQRLAGILGENVLLWRSQMFPKSPGGGPATEFHQTVDFGYNNAPILVPKENFKGNSGLYNISVWIALADVHVENAPIIFVKRSHHTDYFDKSQTKWSWVRKASMKEKCGIAAKFSIGITEEGHPVFDMQRLLLGLLAKDVKELDLKDYEPVTMKAGQFIIFTSKLIHGSLPNISDDDRLALVGRYTSSEIDIYPGSNPVFDYKRLPFFSSPVKMSKESLKPWSVHGNNKEYLDNFPEKNYNKNYFV